MNRFVTLNGRELRCGFTTGAAAALAAKAAVRMLLTGRAESVSSLVTPAGTVLTVPVVDVGLADGEAACSVQKDAGDDPDVTDGVLVRATARHSPEGGVTVEGGAGVGRVTKPGLDQPVGAAAINSVPRRMIADAVRSVCGELGHAGGVAIVVAIPGGEEIAARTFNPNLGIVGGLSIIGTTGVVEPMSARAVVDSVAAEMKMLRAGGTRDVLLTPGNYGESFIAADPLLARRARVKCSNFIGEALDIAAALGFRRVLAVGHVGKFIKLSGGVMDTHSRSADCRLELLALHAGLAGASAATQRRLLDSATVDAGLEILGDLRPAVVASILGRADMYLERRAGGVAAGLLLFGNRRDRLGLSKNGAAIAAAWEREE